jgi:hypothetical protein
VGFIHAFFGVLESAGESVAWLGEALVIGLHPFVIALDAIEWGVRGWRYVAATRTTRVPRSINNPGYQSTSPAETLVASTQSGYEVHVIRDRFGEPYLLLLVMGQLVYVVAVHR